MKHKYEHGAVSLFVVIFAALLITVVTVSFIRLMLQDQEQSSTNDLSQSAYDSALAGVEDAKRALIRYRTICDSGDEAGCSDAYNAINSASCNQGLEGVVTVSPDEEVIVQQSPDDVSLNQAYTCVKMELETDDYLGEVQPNESRIVPLFGSNSFDTILIEWYTTEDLGASDSGSYDIDLPLPPTTGPLLSQEEWSIARPSPLRTQLMQFGTDFRLSDFDANSGAESNANTLFLYPEGITGQAAAGVDSYDFVTRDTRRNDTMGPLAAECDGILSSGGYACRAQLRLPSPIGGGDRTAYLRLTPFYNATHFRISLVGTKFDAVQPSIDSTGRADNLFRRVEARVDLVDTNFPFPDAAVDVSGNFCKNFSVTDDAADYANNCTP